GAERVDRAAGRLRPGVLACVRNRSQSLRPGELEGGRVGLRRIRGLVAAEPDPYDATVAVLGGVPHGVQRFVERVDTRDVRRQADLDAEAFSRFLGAVAAAREDDVAVEPAPEPEREDRLEVDAALRGRLLRVLDGD